jgi:hypothetical protein
MKIVLKILEWSMFIFATYLVLIDYTLINCFLYVIFINLFEKLREK